MDIEGRIILDLGLQSGTSKAGNPWKKREMVLETFGNFPRKVKFHIFGDRVDTINLEVGKDYTLSFDLESREYQGRWYTDVNVFRAQMVNPNQDNIVSEPTSNLANGMNDGPFNNMSQHITPDFMDSDSGSEEDLPF